MSILKRKRSSSLLCIAAVTAVSSAYAGMKPLDDEVLSGVSGQSGLTLDLEANTSVAEIAYFDDGLGIALQGIQLSSAADPTASADYRFKVDILADQTLAIEFNAENTARFEIEEIRFIDTPGLAPVGGSASVGGLFFDFELNGYANLRGGSSVAAGWGHTLDTEFQISNGKIGYRTNGNELLLDGLSLDVSALDSSIGIEPGGVLRLRMPNLDSELSVEAIRFSNNPLNHGSSTDIGTGALLPSMGSLWINSSINADLQVQAEGASGVQGLTLNSTNVINRLDLGWGDDTDFAAAGYWVAALNGSGQVALQNLTIDVLDDADAGVDPAWDFGRGLALGFDQLAINLAFEDVVLGETKATIDAYVGDPATAVKSIGGWATNLVFADGTYQGVARSNRVLLQAGGNVDAGYQGLRLDTQLSVISPTNESNFIYIDDGNALMLSKFEAFADGDLTLDITRAGTLGTTEFYDGLRVGFENFAFGYQFEGLRSAKDTGDINDLKSAEVQSGQGIEGLSPFTMGLAGAPSLQGVLNGHITLGPGGNIGAEGLTINADMSLANGTMASFIEPDGRGLWLSGLNYDVHLRDMMLDVTADGLQIYQGESWSRMDVTDLRVGDQASGASFGRLVLENYELGSTRSISAGGAGALCIGGTGGDSAACVADGGRWEDRGTEGVTISSTRFLKSQIETEGKRNRITWETSRTGEGTASPINDTGMKLVFDNYTTNDGDGVNDTFGIQTDYNFDVASVHVVKKSDGADSNGVVGNKGDVKVMNGDGTYRYVAPSALTAADIANRPVGLAMRTRTQFKELDVERVNLSHPVGGDATLLYGLKFQNMDITTDISTTVLD